MNKVKVRIAVAVAPDGSWNACGFSNARNDADKMELAVEPIPDGEARYWLEAELPMPTTETVQATVAAA
jgi:hypothetical protein